MDTITAQSAAVDAMEGADEVFYRSVELGGKVYVIKEVTFARTFILGDLIIKEADAILKSGLFRTDEEGNLLFDMSDFGSVLEAAAQLWEKIPETFARIICILIDAPRTDADHVLAHLTGEKFFDIYEGALEVNHFEDLAERFFRAREATLKVLSKVRNR